MTRKGWLGAYQQPVQTPQSAQPRARPPMVPAPAPARTWA